jgi:hypothetical protein
MMAIKRILIMSLLLLIIGNCGQDFAAADDDVDDDGGAENSYSHIFGPESRSVKYDPDDKTPYLICAKYMPNECNSTENESCSTTENCRVSSRSDRLACMAVLSRNANGSGSMQVGKRRTSSSRIGFTGQTERVLESRRGTIARLQHR